MPACGRTLMKSTVPVDRHGRVAGRASQNTRCALAGGGARRNRDGNHLGRRRADDAIDGDARAEIHIAPAHAGGEVRAEQVHLLSGGAGFDPRFGGAEHNRVGADAVQAHVDAQLVVRAGEPPAPGVRQSRSTNSTSRERSLALVAAPLKARVDHATAAARHRLAAARVRERRFGREFAARRPAASR